MLFSIRESLKYLISDGNALSSAASAQIWILAQAADSKKGILNIVYSTVVFFPLNKKGGLTGIRGQSSFSAAKDKILTFSF